MSVYLNEWDGQAAAWLRQLMNDGHIERGTVDERSIADVAPDDLRGYRRCHFFSGIAGWELALQLAGWPADRPVWTGSCPCQPFSSAGKREGEADPRDLWPAFFRLIAECRPPVVFGEQVASADVVGTVGGQSGAAVRRVWVDRIQADLETAGYTFGACIVGAHSLGAPHIRQRLYWVAHTQCAGVWGSGHGAAGGAAGAVQGENGERQRLRLDARSMCGAELRNVAHPEGQRCRAGRPRVAGKRRADEPLGLRLTRGLGDPSGERCGETGRAIGPEAGAANVPSDPNTTGVVGDPNSPGPQPRLPATEADGHGRAAIADGGVGCMEHAKSGGEVPAEQRRHEHGAEPTSHIGVALGDANCGRRQQRDPSNGLQGFTDGNGPTLGFWDSFDLIPCRDAKARRVEPGIFPLAHGVPGRVALLRGAGNAIVPQAAAAFIKAFLQTEGGLT